MRKKVDFQTLWDSRLDDAAATFSTVVMTHKAHKTNVEKLLLLLRTKSLVNVNELRCFTKEMNFAAKMPSHKLFGLCTQMLLKNRSTSISDDDQSES